MWNLPIVYRRWLIALLVSTSVIAAVAVMGYLLAGDGLGIIDIVMLLLFSVTVPWAALGFWNSLIGMLILHL